MFRHRGNPATLTSVALLAISIWAAQWAPPSQIADARTAQQCPVSGIIDRDTAWSPSACASYVVRTNVLVGAAATLTIAAGTVVRFQADRQLRVAGTLIARGSPDARIVFTSDAAKPAPGDWNALEFIGPGAIFDELGQYLRGSILQYATVEYGGSGDGAVVVNAGAPFIDHCWIRDNRGNGIFKQVNINVTEGADTRITNNRVENNSAHGVHFGNGGTGTVSGNEIIGNGLYGIHAPSNGLTMRLDVTGNTVRFNRGGGIYYDADGVIIDNKVIQNKGEGIVAASLFFDPVLRGNDLVDNVSAGGSHIELRVSWPMDPGRPQAFNAEGNWWGTVDRDAIAARILDFEDDPELRPVSFEPYLVAPAHGIPDYRCYLPWAGSK